MNLLDVSIIYLACGAPFAVSHYFQPRGRRSVVYFFRSLLVAAVWPVPAVRVLRRRFKPARGRSEADLELIKNKLANAISNGKTVSHLEAREVIEQYAGLSLQLSAGEGDQVAEVFRISRHTDPELAMICLNRRNRMRLDAHHNRARADLFDLMSVVDIDDRNEIRDAAMLLFAAVGDERAGDELDALSDAGLTTLEQGVENKAESDIWMHEPHNQRTAAKQRA